jgi:hypothetical protein
VTTRLAEDLIGAIGVAIRRRDMKGAAALVRMLAIEDPDAAQRILDVLDVARERRS